MKYEVNLTGLDFSAGVTVLELYVNSSTNLVSSNKQPVFHSLEELAIVGYIYGFLDNSDLPSPLLQQYFIFNSPYNLVDNVAGSHKFMVVESDGVSFDVFPNGDAPVPSLQPIASVQVTAPGTGFTSVPTVAPATGTATFTVTLKAVTAAIQAAGTGYAVNDTITLTNGVVLKVLTENVGAIETVSITNAGSLTGTMAANPVAQTSTSGTGTGATFNLSYGINTIVVDTSSTYSTAPALTITGGAGTGATANAVLSAGTPLTNVSNILVKESAPIATSTYLMLVLNGLIILDVLRDSSIVDMGTLVTWLNGNTSLGTFADISNGNIEALSLTGSGYYTGANFIRFR